MFGFYRIATAVPRMRVAGVRFNTEQIIDLIKQGIRDPNDLPHPQLITIIHVLSDMPCVR